MPCSVPNTSASTVRRSPLHARRPPARDLTVDEAIGLFLDSQVALAARERYVITLGIYARRFFAAALSEPLPSLSPKRMRQLAAQVAGEPSAQTGRPLAGSTLQNIIRTARRFTRWCVAQGRLPADPMAKADPIALARYQVELDQLRQELEATRVQLRAAMGER